MNQEIDRYIEAATRSNTRRSYRTAIEHFEVGWGGFLPATSDAIARYLVDHAGALSANTLKIRLAALAQWHLSQGFPDPTKSPVVRQVLKGIRVLHPRQEKQAHPLQLQELEQCILWLERQIQSSTDLPIRRRCLRDRALLLIGFWRAFRSDELCRIRIDQVEAIVNEGMSIYLPWSKTDRQNIGQTFHTPALARFCPVQAYLDWVYELDESDGPAFRRIDRWGNIHSESLHPNSIIPILRSVFQGCGMAADRYSSHSLRRGFATWAVRNGWDQKSLMAYVGWKDPKSSLRYIIPCQPFPNRHTTLSA